MQQRIPYDGNDLGAVYTKKYTAFRLWAPTADAVTLCLYREGDGDCLSDTLPMKRDVQGNLDDSGRRRFAACLLYIPSGEKRQDRGVTGSIFGSCRCERAAEYGAGKKETDPENF